MAMLSKKQILDAPDLKTETVSVPEWGGEVLVKTLNGTQRGEYLQSITSVVDGKPIFDISGSRVKLASLSMVDEDGDLLFDESDVEALGGKNGQALERVCTVAQRLSGMSPEDVAVLAKNSVSAPSGASTSA